MNPLRFSKIGNKWPNFGRECSDCDIYGLNFLFQMQFLRVFRRKKADIFPWGSFFLVFYTIAYRSALIPRKLSCPKIFLVTHIYFTVEAFQALSFFRGWIFCSLLISFFLLLVSFCLLFVTFCSLLVTFCSLLVTFLSIACYKGII